MGAGGMTATGTMAATVSTGATDSILTLSLWVAPHFGGVPGGIIRRRTLTLRPFLWLPRFTSRSRTGTTAQALRRTIRLLQHARRHGSRSHHARSKSADNFWDSMLIFVVGRSRLDRYEELRRQFGGWQDMIIVLDRREGDRRTGQGPHVSVDRRCRVDRRRVDIDIPFMKLGWSVADTDESVSRDP